MGRKMLMALMMEGEFSGEGLHSKDADDMLAVVARELVESSKEPDLPYHGSQMYISEDRPKIEACQGEQPQDSDLGAPIWRSISSSHRAPSMARFRAALLTTLRTAGAVTSKTMRRRC
jgi:hypothetical protein